MLFMIYPVCLTIQTMTKKGIFKKKNILSKIAFPALSDQETNHLLAAY